MLLFSNDSCFRKVTLYFEMNLFLFGLSLMVSELIRDRFRSNYIVQLKETVNTKVCLLKSKRKVTRNTCIFLGYNDRVIKGC